MHIACSYISGLDYRRITRRKVNFMTPQREIAEGRECICDFFDIDEKNGHTASCNRLERGRLKSLAKPKPAPKRIDKVGKKNLFECSDGEKVTQTQINYYRSLCYEQKDFIHGGVQWVCEGCLGKSEGRAHIVPQARCKVIKKTDLIWNTKNVFYACHKCNTTAENISSPAIMQLKNYQRIKAFMLEHDYERATKLPDFSLQTEPHKL